MLWLIKEIWTDGRNVSIYSLHLMARFYFNVIIQWPICIIGLISQLIWLFEWVSINNMVFLLLALPKKLMSQKMETKLKKENEVIGHKISARVKWTRSLVYFKCRGWGAPIQPSIFECMLKQLLHSIFFNWPKTISCASEIRWLQGKEVICYFLNFFSCDIIWLAVFQWTS